MQIWYNTSSYCNWISVNNIISIFNIYHNFKSNVPYVILILGRRLDDGDVIRLKSWKGDYLYRPDTDSGVTTGNTDVGSSWTVVKTDGAIQLKSWKEDFLLRTNAWQGVTTGPTGIGSSWIVTRNGNETSFRSWRGDFLHRPDSHQGVTTWHTGIGNRWVVEIITRGKMWR